MKKKRLFQRAVALFCTMNMLGGSILQDSGISFFADKVYAAGEEEEIVSINALSEDKADGISENEAAPAGDGEISGNEAAESASENKAAGDEDNPAADPGSEDAAEIDEEETLSENSAGEDNEAGEQSDVYAAMLTKDQLEVFYKFESSELDEDGVKVSLTTEFKEALENDGSLTAGSYTWNSGDPVPDPGVEYVTDHKTYKIVELSDLFSNLENVKSISLKDWDHTVERPYRDMSGMFRNSRALKCVYYLELNTPHLENLNSMFSDCVELEAAAPLLKTASVTKMISMFSYCFSLKNVDLYYFDTSSLKNMAYMFYHCKVLEVLNLDNFGLSGVERIDGAFSECPKLRRLNLSSFDFSNIRKATGNSVTGADDAFHNTGAGGLTIYVRDEEAAAFITDENNDTEFNAETMKAVVFDLNALDDEFLERIYVYELLEDGTYRLKLSDRLKDHYNDPEFSIPFDLFSIKGGGTLPNPDSVNSKYHGKISSFKQLFWGMDRLTKIDLSLFDGKTVTDFSQMFQGCGGLQVLDIRSLQPQEGADLGWMLYGTGCKTYESGSGRRKLTNDAEARLHDSSVIERLKDPVTAWEEERIKLVVRYHVYLDYCGKGDDQKFEKKEGSTIGTWYASYPGFRFDGFYLDKEYTKPFDTENTPVNSDLLLYEKWVYNLKMIEKELEQFYDYTPDGNGGLMLKLKDGFRSALEEENGLYIIDRDEAPNKYTWAAGDPLPDPGSTHHYGGEELPVSSYNSLFKDCNAKELDLSKWDTSNVTDMSAMFERVEYLRKLDISSFDTAKVTTMKNMFVYLGDEGWFGELDLRHFDVSNVTDMTDMFEFSNITGINIDSWKAPALNKMKGMFWCCFTNEIFMRKFEIPDDCDISLLFQNNHGYKDTDTCVYLKNTEVRNLLQSHLSEYGNAKLRFIVDDDYGELSDADLEKFYIYDTYEVEYLKVSLTDEFRAQLDKKDGKIVIGGGSYIWRAGDPLPDPAPSVSVKYKDNVVSYMGLFKGCKAEALDLSLFDTGNIKDYREMFKDCTRLKKLDLGGFKIDASDKVTDMLSGTCASNTGTPVMGTIDDAASAVILNDSAKTGIDTSKLTFMKMYIVHFNAGGGSGTMPDMAVEAGGSITLPECTFTPPAGTTFEKWDKGAPGEKYKPEGSCTVKAIWKHEHNGVKAAAKEPGCTEKGNIEYWKCSVCETCFKDAACTQEIAEADTVLAELGHDWDEWVITDPATDGHDGMEERICRRNASHKEQRVIGAHSIAAEWEIVFDDDAVYKAGGVYYADYTGRSIKPYVKLVHRGKECALGVDYTLKYGKNIAAGEDAGSVTVKGKGSLKGQKTLKFTILKKDLADGDVIAGNTVYDEKKTADPLVTYNGMVLKKGKDYELERVGDTSLKIKALAASNYSGEKSVTIRAVSASQLKNNKIKADFKASEHSFNFYEHLIGASELTVKDAAGNILTKDFDYCISYTENVRSGKVSVLIFGAGDYAGLVKKSFKIKAASKAEISVKTDKDVYIYAKGGVKPKLSVKATIDGISRDLKEGRDYSVKFSKNKKAGTGSFRITMKGDYKGAVYSGNKNFTILPAQASDSNMNIVVQDMAFKKAGVYKPKVSITVNGELLKKSDYELKYTNGGKMDAPGTLKVDIRLKGNYTSLISLYANAHIVEGKTDIGKAKITLMQNGNKVKEVPLKGGKVIFDLSDANAVQPVLKIGDKTISGAELKSGFDLIYADNAAAGKATIIVRAKDGNPEYAGMCSGTYRIRKAEIGVE
ncbi:MAG: BspA family leucine-rich repeat surface protein [Lachnospiraceae bacterium]|nr:BspA family leucine-rich repeat surface protein [Lachnospiraceae bacterium]